MRLIQNGSYVLEVKEQVIAFFGWMLVCGAAGWLFYDSFFMGILGIAGWPFFKKMITGLLAEKLHSELAMSFKEVMISVYSSLSAGATVEQSLIRALEDLSANPGENIRMQQELKLVCTGMVNRVPVGKCLDEMAARCGNRDIESFVRVIMMGKRQGGRLPVLVKDTMEKIQDRIEINYEIEGMIGAKRSEFLFMCMIPAGIMAYMKIFSPDFMEILYGNLVGIALMTGCLMIYMLSILWGIRILNKAKVKSA